MYKWTCVVVHWSAVYGGERKYSWFCYHACFQNQNLYHVLDVKEQFEHCVNFVFAYAIHLRNTS